MAFRTTNYIAYGDRNALINSRDITVAETLTDVDSGKVLVLNGTEGAAINLPSLKKGLNFEFVVGKAFTTSNYVINTADEEDLINGIIVSGAATPVGLKVVDKVKVTLTHANSIEGDNVKFVADPENEQWLVTGSFATNGAMTAA